LAPDVNVRVATETVGGRKIARNPRRFRTPCCTPTVLRTPIVHFNLYLAPPH
jgi:hypothetical protein